MSTFQRVVLAAVVALLMAGAGAVGGFALHWFVLSPSDDELRGEVAKVTPDGLTIVGVPTITGKWAPSLERGDLHWELAPAPLSAAAVSSHLDEAGWDVEYIRPEGSSTYLGATKGPMHLRVRFASPEDDGSAAIGFTLRRRDYPISSGTVVALGSGLAALMGGALVWFGPRLRARKSSWGIESHTRALAHVDVPGPLARSGIGRLVRSLRVRASPCRRPVG